ncbi:MAG TPA: zf-HC2 domain-containing protein [Terriglobia bacterium]|nr:zf-HC2 domain-containing protein [Terriglobia bacterium]
MNVLNFDSRQCERTRRQMDAYLSNELLVETTDEMLRHLENCQACSRELESRMRVREALQRAAASQPVPDGLGEAIHQRLKKAQSRSYWAPRAPTWTLALAGAALMVIVGIAGQQWIKLDRARQMVASVLHLGVSDHLHCAIRGHNYPDVANPTEVLRKKLGPQYAGLLPVVEKKLTGFQVLEAHICTVPGSPRKYVHFITRGQGTILSVILTKRDGGTLPAGRFVATASFGNVNFYEKQLEGMSVAGFQVGGYFGFVVSNLGQHEMGQLAEGLAPELQTALKAGEGRATNGGPFTSSGQS